MFSTPFIDGVAVHSVEQQAMNVRSTMSVMDVPRRNMHHEDRDMTWKHHRYVYTRDNNILCLLDRGH